MKGNKKFAVLQLSLCFYVITDQRISMKQYLFMLLQSTFHISQTLKPNVNNTLVFATAHVHYR